MRETPRDESAMVFDGSRLVGRAHRYVGPAAIRETATRDPQRALLMSATDVRRWCLAQMVRQRQHGPITVTFVVDLEERLWIADRRSEHVACAGGRDVLAAGELTFEFSGEGIAVVECSNQSTGYCPEIARSWQALAWVLDRMGIRRPPHYTAAFEFRRCDGCEAINLIKEDVFECAICGAALNPVWNF